MSISFKGYNTSTLTFPAASSLAAGMPVTVNSDGAAAPASAEQDFIGICTAIREGWASVQTDGYVESVYSGDAPTLGMCALTTASGNKIAAADEGGIPYKVLSVDTVNKTVGFIL